LDVLKFIEINYQPSEHYQLKTSSDYEYVLIMLIKRHKSESERSFGRRRERNAYISTAATYEGRSNLKFKLPKECLALQPGDGLHFELERHKKSGHHWLTACLILNAPKDLGFSKHLLAPSSMEEGLNQFSVNLTSDGGAIFGQLSLSKETSASPLPLRLSIEEGIYYDCVMPENVAELWGPVPFLKKLPQNVENTCKAVTHRIVDSSGSLFFSVYLVHSLPLEMSAVQLFVGNQMSIVAHLVGRDTLGEANESLGIDAEVSKQ